MPIVGAGLHIAIAIFCAIHVVRTGQQLYWLFVLFSFPLLGSIVYAFAIYLPQTRVPRHATQAMRAVGRALDPGRDVREARLALEDTPTAQNQMRLAAALLNAGQLDEAAATYDQCLQGPFANDLDVRWGAAQVQLARQRADQALVHLAMIDEINPRFREEAVALLRGKALAQLQRHEEASAAFASAVNRFGSFEAKAEHAIWAWQYGHTELAQRLQGELETAQRRWNRHTRELNASLLARLKAAQAR